MSDQGTSTEQGTAGAALRHRPELPSRLRLLCIGAAEPSCVNLASDLEKIGHVGLGLRWISVASEALATLRETSFDCVLIQAQQSEQGPNALVLLQAIRAGGCDDALVIVTPDVNDELWLAAYAGDAEVLVTAWELESPAAMPAIQRAMGRVELVRENRRLVIADRRRVSRERDEAEHLLGQQRQMISGLELLAKPSDDELDFATTAAESAVLSGNTDAEEFSAFDPNRIDPSPSSPRVELPAEVNEYYQELLRTYVIMGSGNLGTEIARLADLLSAMELSPRQALEVHLERVEQLVRGLGSRSARHVLSRADLLALELMIYLGEAYQRRSEQVRDDSGPHFLTVEQYASRQEAA